MIIFKQFAKQYAKEFSDFVKEHPYGNIFHSIEWINILNKCLDCKCVAIMAVNTGTGKICGVVVGMVRTEKNGLLSFLSTRTIVIGGPLVEESDDAKVILTELLIELKHHAGKKSLYVELWNMFDRPFEQFGCLEIPGFKFIDHLNFIIDLDSSPDQIFAKFSKTRRKNIRRAIKYGVTVTEVKTNNGVKKLYSLLEETYNRVGVPLDNFEVFDLAFKNLQPVGNAHFYLAYCDGVCIGGRVVLLYKEWIYDWYAGSRKDSFKKYPDELLIWHILQWGMEHKYKYFNFGGAGKPDKKYGPREFKGKFGGELVNYGRYINITAPIRYFFALKGYYLYKKLCKFNS
ncbi:MAG: GNAT family N-acetyltransferase [Bacteroidetes bacterium]|nr:GNAT family N-acetyltransferase [Bacteroidota bacterium]